MGRQKQLGAPTGQLAAEPHLSAPHDQLEASDGPMPRSRMAALPSSVPLAPQRPLPGNSAAAGKASALLLFTGAVGQALNQDTVGVPCSPSGLRFSHCGGGAGRGVGAARKGEARGAAPRAGAPRAGCACRRPS